MLSLIKKSLIWIVSGTASIILTACYGPPTDPACFVQLKTVDPNNDPIPGLAVSRAEYGQDSYTSSDGIAYLDGACHADIVVTITDVDGAENGSFLTKTVGLSELNVDEQGVYVVVMEWDGTPVTDGPGLPDAN